MYFPDLKGQLDLDVLLLVLLDSSLLLWMKSMNWTILIVLLMCTILRAKLNRCFAFQKVIHYFVRDQLLDTLLYRSIRNRLDEDHSEDEEQTSVKTFHRSTWFFTSLNLFHKRISSKFLLNFAANSSANDRTV